MSFFAKNTKFADSGTGDFEIAEAGVYVCRLTEVEVTERPDFNDPAVMKPSLVWKFETTSHFDSQDRPYRFVYFTGDSYGNEKAKLTQMLDWMVGRRLTRDEFRALDLDSLKEQPWRVVVSEEKSAAGKDINKISSIKPAQKSNRPAPKPVATDDAEDPFAE